MIFEAQTLDLDDPGQAVTACIESGSGRLLFDASALPPEVFDLKNGVFGELVHRLSVYRIRMAAVLPDEETLPERFREFIREANAGRQFRFLATRDAAIEWLSKDDG